MTETAPVILTVSLSCHGHRAFTAFVREIGSWWPAAFTASQGHLADVTIEPRPGGRVYETDDKGGGFDWGTVSRWEPEHTIVLAWTLGHGARPTEVELRFTETGGGTCDLRLEHRAWDETRITDRAKFADPDGGWIVVLTAYQKHVCGPETAGK